MRVRLKLSAVIFLLFSAGYAQAASILFAMVDGNAAYKNDGLRIATFLQQAGNNVVVEDMASTNAIGYDYSIFDQVWVYDLSSGPDNSIQQLSWYQGIAEWHYSRSNKNIIADGRILSSAWSTAQYQTPAEALLLQNYAAQLDLRGGGIVLGTDSGASATSGLQNFQSGINTINDLLGIDQFSGGASSSLLEVDSSSPLYVDMDFYDCDCIRGDSGGGFSPVGLQANGLDFKSFAKSGQDSTLVSYALEDVPQVPIPGAAWLFSSALVGLGLMRGRKKQGR